MGDAAPAGGGDRGADPEDVDARWSSRAWSLGAVGGLVAIGNPVDRLDNAWHSFKGGYDDNTGSGQPADRRARLQPL